MESGGHCYAPDGTMTVRVPEPVSNITFGGGPKNNRLLITASTSLYSLGCR